MNEFVYNLFKNASIARIAFFSLSILAVVNIVFAIVKVRKENM